MLAMNFAVSSLINIVSCYARFIFLDKPSLLARRLLGGSAWLATLPDFQCVMTVYEVGNMINLSSAEN
jgi:hypothetical protein